MDVEFTLTEGGCKTMFAREAGKEFDDVHPILQVVSIKKHVNAQAPQTPRNRIIISDGGNFLQAMITTQMNHLVDSNELAKHTVIQVKKWINNVVQPKDKEAQKISVLLDLTILGTPAQKIGDPKPLDHSAVQPAQDLDHMTGVVASGPSAAPVAASSRPKPQPNKPAGGGDKYPVFPIEGLNPYAHKWTIKARVTRKSDIRTWSNQRGEGKLFDVILMDETAEIKATGFNQVVDELYPKFEEGKVYYISKAKVSIAKKKFSNLSNDYELSLERNTEIEECTDTADLPEIKYHFTEISQLETLQKDALCDVLAVVHEIGPLAELTSKATNKQFSKRDLTLVDRSGFSVRMTLFGKQAESFTADDQPVMAFKALKVGDFGGRTLSAWSSSMMTAHPDMDDAHALRGWYDGGGKNGPFQSQSGGGGGGGAAAAGTATFNRSEVKPIGVVRESETIGQGDKADYFSCRGSVMHIKDTQLYYTSCPGEGCQKKVIETDNGWRCEKCDRSYEAPEYRYLMSVSVVDDSGQLWLQAFNDVGLLLMGMPASKLHEMKENDPDGEFAAALAGASGKMWNFSCRAKMETYNDTTRARYGIQRVWPVDFKSEGMYLLERLKRYPAEA